MPISSAACARGFTAALSLVAAPAGWGKTSLLAEWLTVEDEAAVRLGLARRGRQRPGALLGLRLRRRCARRASRSPPPSRPPWPPPGPRAGDAALPLLINALATAGRPYVLVLDDYHLITDAAVHDGVRFLLDHLPRAAHLVIATRTEPPVGISRLRARGELDEIASEQLRFSDAEAAALLNDTLALALAPDELALLSERTEGWAAGLYLAGLSLRDRPGPRGAEDLAYDRHLVDYLGDEVVSAQDPQARSFLVETCVLDRLSAPLCDAVRGEGGSKRAAERDRAGQPVPRAARRAPRVVSLPPCLPRRPATRARGHAARPSTSPSCTRGPGHGARRPATCRAPSATCWRRGARPTRRT